jgi:hypothetical protein
VSLGGAEAASTGQFTVFFWTEEEGIYLAAKVLERLEREGVEVGPMIRVIEGPCDFATRAVGNLPRTAHRCTSRGRVGVLALVLVVGRHMALSRLIYSREILQEPQRNHRPHRNLIF